MKTPTTEEQKEGMLDSTGESCTLGGHGVHDDSVAAEIVWTSITAAGELATTTAGGHIPGSLLVSREASPRGERSPVTAVHCTYASPVSKPESNRGGVGRDRGRVRQMSGDAEAERRLDLMLEFMAGVLWWRWFVNWEI